MVTRLTTLVLVCSAKSCRLRPSSHLHLRLLALGKVRRKSIKVVPESCRGTVHDFSKIPLKSRDSPELSLPLSNSAQTIHHKSKDTTHLQKQGLPLVKPAWRRMKSFLQVLTTPTADTPGTSLILNFADKRYIIGNIHEGTQRAVVEEGARLAKLSEIFLTGKTEWSTHGGLIGIILTLADTISTAKDAAIAHKISKAQNRLQRDRDRLEKKHPQRDAVESTTPDEVPPETLEKRTLTIHGGPNVTHTLAAARRFIFRKGTPVTVNEIRETEKQENWEPTWTDSNIRVWAMSINPSQVAGTSLGGNTPSPRKRSFEEFQEKSASSTMTNNEALVPHSTAIDVEDQDQQLRRAIVSDMFDSDWRLDNLVETPIAQVNPTTTIFIRNPATHKIEKYTGPLPGGPDALPLINVLIRKPWPGALIAQVPPTRPSATALSYIIRNHPQRGRFLPEKAKALNVEKGRKFGELTMGNPVTSVDGKTVLPEQVMAPGKPGSGFAVIELPTRDYVYELINRPEWRASEVMEGVEAFIWILGLGVGEDSSLINFMNEFKSRKHVVSSQEDCPNLLSMDSAATGAIRLHQIDPKRHPVPIHNNVSAIARDDSNLPSRLTPDCLIAKRGLTVHLEPSFFVQETSVKPPLNTSLVIYQTPKDVLLLAKSIQDEIASSSFRRMINLQDLPSPNGEIICLGTGSALPSKYRNVSATLLRVPGSGSYLLDCGENTLGQLNRVYRPEELVEVLRDLKMIWISHLHADHHLGTVSVIKAWYQAVYGKDYKPQIEPNVALAEQNLDPAKVWKEQKRLFVASDAAMLNWLQEYASVEDYGYDLIVALKVTAAKPGKPRSTKFEWNSRTLSFQNSPFSQEDP